MPRSPESRQRAIERNKAYVGEIRKTAVCVKCGGQPVDLHREEHVSLPHRRISELVANAATIATIDQELELCTPLCRRCHREEDGRAASHRRLTDDQVREIRTTYAKGGIRYRDLAQTYEVGVYTISCVINRKRYAHVE